MSRNEANRPRYHFTPSCNWMNDPNGLVYYQGEYHLFYQYNPYETKWGHMSWGHAVSPDMLHWTDLPVALFEQPEKGYTMFSGSAVVDWHNTTGFGRGTQPPLVAVYTVDYHAQPRLEDIHIAYSTDCGRTFMEYPGNPVLHVGNPKFGDPKAFWHEPSKQWILVTILGLEQGKVVLYGSPDLRAWHELSEFTAAEEAPGVWECPDLFPIAVGGDGQSQKWLLKVNCVGSPRPDRSRFFVGDFDGQTFHRDAGVKALIPERGDLYAEVTYNGIPALDGRRILVGWIRQQASETRSWTGMQSVPRMLSLRSTSTGFHLCQSPVRELALLHGQHTSIAEMAVSGESPLFTPSGASAGQLDIVIDLEAGSAAAFGVRLRLGASQCDIGYAPAAQVLYVDRPDQERLVMPAALKDGRIRLHVLVDRSVVEVFGGEGEATITAVLEPDAVCDSVHLFAHDGAARLLAGQVWTMASVW